jgi:type VI secretion system secreted protein Hcp
MYIKFEQPAIQGSSTAAGHADEIEILGWSHGFVQPTSPTRGGGGSGSVEQATHQNLTFTKYLDSASKELMKYCWEGKQFQKVIVSCYRSDGATDNRPVPYLTIAMEHVIISNYSVSGGPGDLPVENVSLDYGVVQYNYIDHRNADGGLLKSAEPLRAEKLAAKKES